MKVFLFANGFGDIEGISGGDRFFIELGKEWNVQGHEVHIFTPKTGYNICRREEATDCIFHVTKSPGIRRLGLTWEYLYRMIATSFRSFLEKPEIVFSSSDYLYDVFPAYILKLRWKDAIWLTTVFHIMLPPFQRRGKAFHRDLESFVSQRLSLQLIRSKVDVIVTDNSETKNILVSKFKIPSNKIHLAINVPDYDKIKKVQVKSQKFDACYLGRIDRKKGVFDLIKIWSLVCKVKRDAKLIMVGTGEEKVTKKLRETISKYKLQDNITLAGFVSEEEKFKTLKESHVFVFASYEEGWPSVFTEAMACNLPIITYFLPAYKDFEESLIKVKLGDKKDFANTIIQILLNQDVRNEFISRGSNAVGNLSWRNIAENILYWCLNTS